MFPHAAKRMPMRFSSPTHSTSSSHLLGGLRAIQSSRCSSYLSATGSSTKQRTTVGTLRAMYKRHEPITLMTASDFPSALIAGETDVVLVGDSLSMVSLGRLDTTQVNLEDMIHHCRSVTRGIKTSFVVCDLPMGSYETSPKQALSSAIRLVKEGQAQGVKLECGREMAPTVSKIVEAGIPVLGHVGLQPQRRHIFGGFKTQGKTCDDALSIFSAMAIQAAGCFAIVLEAVPGDIAAVMTDELSVPTIGVGAGLGCSGQGLVQADLVGQLPPGSNGPRFVKRYGNVWRTAREAVCKFRAEVKNKEFPMDEHIYPVSDGVTQAFKQAIGNR